MALNYACTALEDLVGPQWVRPLHLVIYGSFWLSVTHTLLFYLRHSPVYEPNPDAHWYDAVYGTKFQRQLRDFLHIIKSHELHTPALLPRDAKLQSLTASTQSSVGAQHSGGTTIPFDTQAANQSASDSIPLADLTVASQSSNQTSQRASPTSPNPGRNQLSSYFLDLCFPPRPKDPFKRHLRELEFDKKKNDEWLLAILRKKFREEQCRWHGLWCSRRLAFVNARKVTGG